MFQSIFAAEGVGRLDAYLSGEVRQETERRVYLGCVNPRQARIFPSDRLAVCVLSVQAEGYSRRSDRYRREDGARVAGIACCREIAQLLVAAKEENSLSFTTGPPMPPPN